MTCPGTAAAGHAVAPTTLDRTAPRPASGFSTLQLLCIAGVAALAAPLAQASPVSYEIRLTFSYSDAATGDVLGPGAATLSLSWELGASAPFGFSEEVAYDLAFTQGALDGVALSAATDFVELQQRARADGDATTLRFTRDDPRFLPDIEVTFAGLFADPETLGPIDPTRLLSGLGYGSDADQRLVDFAVVPIPLPASGALLAALTGGIALREAAKRRRAARRARHG